MRGNTLMTMLFFVMLFGSLALPANIVNSTSLLDERKLTLIFCAQTLCNYFTPDKFTACYCCPDVIRKEYCHLKLEDCRANCATCKPNWS
ncbi:hypothetical protein PAHAL_5G500300 [Panicum hallii]|uniref:Bowman-Birk serine protease inhibitors family domain-containing protein n=1 Tax=Panicum hallii TaxID=206008 RepID=A0A2T8IP29_9POAL|nr:hypothetical protein PAHAL_5G500300 [Panicum hallii]